MTVKLLWEKKIELRFSEYISFFQKITSMNLKLDNLDLKIFIYFDCFLSKLSNFINSKSTSNYN